MPVFNCTLELKDEEQVIYQDIYERPRAGKTHVNDFTKELLTRFNYWVSKDKLTERKDLELMGLCLYNVLLPAGSNIRDEFESNYDFIKDKIGPSGRLRLTLVFHKEAKELANYPWEFLYMPPRNQPKRDGFFLAGQKTALILTRFVPGVEHYLGEREEKLRILVVLSNPYEKGLPDIDTKETKEVIAKIEALRKSAVQVITKKNPTYKELKDAINAPVNPGERAFRPHIVHFIGHGDKNQGLALKMSEEDLENREQYHKKLGLETAWVNSETITDLFPDDPPPRLVFLHACETAQPSTLEGFSDLARELVRAKIPAVIAMQYAIKTSDAALFATVFYAELSKGCDVDEAVRMGREALGLPVYGGQGSWSDRRFGTPVIYLQSEKAIVDLQSEKVIVDIEGGGVDHNQMVPCPNPKCLDSFIPSDSTCCVACDHDVMPCPTCAAQNVARLMDKTLGRCSKCGYRLLERQPVLTAAGEVSRPAQEEALSAAAPQPPRPAVETFVETSPTTAQAGLGRQSATGTIDRPERGATSNNSPV